MAKKTKRAALPTPSSNLVPAVQKRNIAPATIVESEDEQFSDINRPDFLTDDMVEDEAPTGFNPLIDFEDEPGRWIVAKYIGTRTGVGPNNSNMYDFEAYNSETKKMFTASLWGSHILDRKMEMLTGKGSLTPGKFCFVQYLGAVETQRKMNPAKNFKIAVIRDGAMDKYLAALKADSAANVDQAKE